MAYSILTPPAKSGAQPGWSFAITSADGLGSPQILYEGGLTPATSTETFDSAHVIAWDASTSVLWTRLYGFMGAELRRTTVTGEQTTLFNGFLFQPLWNADRQELIFTHLGNPIPSATTTMPGPDGRLIQMGGGIWIYDARSRQLSHASWLSVRRLAWPPNGASDLAFYRLRENTTELYLRRNDQDRLVLTSAFMGEAHPLIWSPDATRLAFGKQIVTLDGHIIATLSGQNVEPVGWSSYGLLYKATPDGGRRSLYRWDEASNHLIATDVTYYTTFIIPQ